MRYSTIISTLLLVLIVLTAFGGFFINQAAEPSYNVTISDDFRGVYTNTTVLAELVEETTGIGVNMSDSAREAKTLEGDFEDPSKAQIKTLKIIYSSYGIISSLVLNTAEILHLPPILVGVILAMLVFTLLFGFISMVFRWRA